MRKNQLIDTIKSHDGTYIHDELSELRNTTALILQIDEVERNALFKIWRENKISHQVMTQLMQQLDHKIRHFT